MGGKRGRLFRNIYKGHMDRAKVGGGIKGGRWGWLGLGKWCRGRAGMETTVLEQQ